MNDQKVSAKLKEFLSGATIRAIYQSRGMNIDDLKSFADGCNRFIEMNYQDAVDLPIFNHEHDDIELFAMDLATFITGLESGKVQLRI